MNRIILIRHGETRWNAERRFQGKTDIPLSETGIEQVNLLCGLLESVKIDKIYSSPLKRAVMTAEPLARAKKLSVVTRAELTEIDFGHWEGLTLEEIKAAYPEEHLRSRNDPFTYGFRDGLPFDCVKKTAERFASECLNTDTNENIAVVSHSVILKMLLLILLGLPPQSLHSFSLSNCSVSIVKACGDFCKNVLEVLGLCPSAFAENPAQPPRKR